jgi:uncharacterized lipoprotein YddW (UPF0748 family)
MRGATQSLMATMIVAAGLLLVAGCRSSVVAPPPSGPLPRAGAPPAAAGVNPVLVVQATSSTSSETERNYSGRLAARIAAWLRDCGVPATPVTDDDVAAGRFGTARIAILASNPEPGVRELAALKRFVARGGRLVVFYSASPGLADLMGLRLGPPQTAPKPGEWGGFRFIDPALEGFPARVAQEPRLLRPAYPDSRGARVIATWETALGKPLQIPAWLATEHGFWMTHVMLEGDVAVKKQMLVAMLGACDPAIWRAAADHAVRTAGTLGRFGSAAECIRRVAALTPPGDSRAEALLAQAGRLQDDMVRSYRNGSYSRTLGTARLLDVALTEAYARTAATRKGEFRGVWNHSGLGLYPGDWDATCALLASQGILAVFPNVQRPGAALYPTRVVPVSESVSQLGDSLAAAVAAGLRRGVDVHAWIILWNLEGAPAPFVASLRRAERLQVSASGAPLDWLCPSHPDNRAYELAAIRDLAARYAVAGIHLDYVRYKSGDYCFCRGCRTRFTRDTGLAPRRWPADVRTGPQAAAYRDWRRGRITTFVAAVRETVRQVNPALKLSAAVYPGYPGCRDSIAQDWGEWLRTGLLDFACPMNYSADTGQAVGWYRKQAAHPGVRGRLYPGIGVTANESRLSAVDTIEQIGALRREGAGGFVLFDLNRTLEKDILPYMRMGLTSVDGR